MAIPEVMKGLRGRPHHSKAMISILAFLAVAWSLPIVDVVGSSREGRRMCRGIGAFGEGRKTAHGMMLVLRGGGEDAENTWPRGIPERSIDLVDVMGEKGNGVPGIDPIDQVCVHWHESILA